MLVESTRYTRRDKEAWDRLERIDAVWCRSDLYRRRVEEAQWTLSEFVEQHPTCYASISWGKDSTVLAHLVATLAPQIPCLLMRLPAFNPDYTLVRDAFLSRWTLSYREIEPVPERDANGYPFYKKAFFDGWKKIHKDFGRHHITGLRGEESSARSIRMQSFGLSSATSCCPLGHWEGRDVWAYLHEHELPVHPVYACSQGGLWERDRLRVGMIAQDLGERTQKWSGTGHGRREHDQLYYRDFLGQLERERLGYLQTHGGVPVGQRGNEPC